MLHYSILLARKKVQKLILRYLYSTLLVFTHTIYSTLLVSTHFWFLFYTILVFTHLIFILHYSPLLTRFLFYTTRFYSHFLLYANRFYSHAFYSTLLVFNLYSTPLVFTHIFHSTLLVSTHVKVHKWFFKIFLFYKTRFYSRGTLHYSVFFILLASTHAKVGAERRQHNLVRGHQGTRTGGDVAVRHFVGEGVAGQRRREQARLLRPHHGDAVTLHL